MKELHFVLVCHAELGLDGVDIYQSYWHHFEFSRSLSITKGSIDQATDFLIKCAAMPDLKFSTAHDAADAYENAYSTDGS